jgi:hypothetical protein
MFRLPLAQMIGLLGAYKEPLRWTWPRFRDETLSLSILNLLSLFYPLIRSFSQLIFCLFLYMIPFV